MAHTDRPSMPRRAWFAFAALSIIWGVPYFFTKIALYDLTPAWVAFARVVCGVVALLPFVPRRDWAALRPHAWAIIAVALTDIALPFYLIANGERFISSSLTGLLLSAMPICVALLAFALDRHERLTRNQAIGLALGVSGVATLLGFDTGHERSALLGCALITGATISYSVGVILIKRWLDDLPMLATTTAMLVVAAVLLGPAALLHRPAHVPGIASSGAVVILGIACTAGAYLLYFKLIATVGATRASVVTYLNPAVATLLGVAVLGESMNVSVIAGLLLVLAGSWLSTGGRPPWQRTTGRSRAGLGRPASAPRLGSD